ncbi:hypothetical protein BKA82DRAFT_157137, partial [Pisolithus tinctorius]
RHHHHCQLLYLVHWAGYENTDEETSWLLATELDHVGDDHASDIVSTFHECYPHKSGPYQPLP